MTEKWENQAVFSEFDIGLNDQSVSLYSGNAVLWVGGSKFDVSCECYLKLIPEPIIQISVTKGIGYRPIEFNDELRMSFEENLDFELLPIRHWYDSVSGEKNIIGVLRNEPSLVSAVQPNADRVEFHLFDFVKFCRSGCMSISDMGSLSRMKLKSENYEITLNSLDNTEENIKATKEDGVVRLTHMGVLCKNDGSNLTFDEYMSLQLELSSFLTFLKGGRTWPCLITGYSGGTSAFRALSAPIASKNGQSWFDPYSASDAENLYPLFSSLWAKSVEWKSCLTGVIYWYAQSNTRGGNPGIDACIILAQTAVEKLAYQYLVVDRNIISPNGFDKLMASDKIRMIGSCLGIPLHIQPVTENIYRESTVTKWCDIPHALTDIRNSLVHPKNKKYQDSIQECYLEALRLFMWLLDLSVLAVCGYMGQYKNRLEVPYCPRTPVPWVAKEY
ncbi:hypothetical protein [Thalassolituus alkanivorans]|uniref:hypothetical protein n=1 Tax=Thalassolituus alkanivorans TaxID=2881055 RepID=UPI001E301D28|nr:hypothetical protein [Thalassolituus alkanivorans]MCB2385038.1 hypothetical protein [Thalassolituus alkanivorans]MCB2424510.1 hypothetical protein [Thalassolituus alkanivorans]